MVMKTTESKQKAGEFLANMPLIQRNLNHKLTNTDCHYDSGKAMTEVRFKQVIEVCRSLSRSK